MAVPASTILDGPAAWVCLASGLARWGGVPSACDVSHDDEHETSPLARRGALIAGKYRVERVIATGGMGTVLEARHEVLEQDVAIKLMRPAIAEHAELAQRFLREARAAARVASDYVARVTDVATLDDGTPYMVMEYLRGEDLATVLERGEPEAICDAVDYVMQALSGIATAHKLGVVHRDLKPANLFLVELAEGRRIKVLDFGISKVMDESEPDGLRAGTTTAANAVLGTPRYMSPEQVSSAKNVDGRTDIWSMGLILYELLTRSYPFEGHNSASIMASILTTPVTTLRAHRGEIAPELDEVVRRCLEKDRERRFPTARAMMVALAPFASARVRAMLLDPRDAASRADDATLAGPAGVGTTGDGAAAGSGAGAAGRGASPSAASAGTPARGSATEAAVAMESRASVRAPRRWRMIAIASTAAALLAVGWYLLRGSTGEPTREVAAPSQQAATPVAVAAPPPVVSPEPAASAPVAAPPPEPSVAPADDPPPSTSAAEPARSARPRPARPGPAPPVKPSVPKPSAPTDDILGSRN